MFHRMAGPYRLVKRNSKEYRRVRVVDRAELQALMAQRACFEVRSAQGALFRVGSTCRRGGEHPRITHLLGGGAKRKRRR